MVLIFRSMGDYEFYCANFSCFAGGVYIFFMQTFYTFHYLVALRLFKGKFFCPLSFLGWVYFAFPILYSEIVLLISYLFSNHYLTILYIACWVCKLGGLNLFMWSFTWHSSSIILFPERSACFLCGSVWWDPQKDYWV